jgi:hypothetical protein
VTDLAEVNMSIATVAQQWWVNPSRRYYATTVATGHLPIGTVDYDPLIQYLFVVLQMRTYCQLTNSVKHTTYT